jgi:hypothetical protein
MPLVLTACPFSCSSPMNLIRAFERRESSRVAELYERTMRSGARVRSAGLAAYFERTVLDYPWSDPDLPSLVFEC